MAKTPVVRHLRYLLDHTLPNDYDSHYIDLAKDLSAVNRRFYRQGKVYHIAGATMHSTSTVFAKIAVVPNTWVTRNAWNRGLKLWNKMNRKALSGGITKPAYNDYKVRLVDAMRGNADLPVPNDSAGNAVLQGEWVYSEYVTPDGTATDDEFTAHFLGDHVGAAGSRTSVSLVQSYAESRGTVSLDQPKMDTDAGNDPLVNLFDDGTTIDDIADNLKNDNDSPPYAVSAGTDATVGDVYPGAGDNMPMPLVVAEASTSFVGGVGQAQAYFGGFSAIAGLLQVETRSDQAEDTIELLIELMPGNYKGVAASQI